jgi:hypothetical protein
MQRVPWEWEVSADLFNRDVADKGTTASAEECRQAQRSDSSPGRYDLREGYKSTREYYRKAKVLPFEVSGRMSIIDQDASKRNVILRPPFFRYQPCHFMRQTCHLALSDASA